MQLYTILSPCNYIPYYPHANLYPIISMQIYTLLSPCKSIPYYPHGMITPPFPVLPIFTTDGRKSRITGKSQKKLKSKI